jgi:hypothetical protein
MSLIAFDSVAVVPATIIKGRRIDMLNSKIDKKDKNIVFRSAYDLLQDQQEQQQKNTSTSFSNTTAVAVKNSKRRKRRARNEQSQKLAEASISK